MRHPQPHEILLPVRPGFIGTTLVAALLLNLLPWSGVVELAKPDFVALALLYWYVYEPRKLGFTSAWLLGLVTDVADASLFGEHALAYTLLAYTAVVLHRRVRRFTIGLQVLHTMAFLVLPLFAILIVRLAAGADFPGMLYFGACVTGAALWPLVVLLFQLPQRPTMDPHVSI